jgi:hypothetical protein
MSLTKHLIYRSANGDCWSLMTDRVSGRKFVRHEANPSSGGHLTDTDVEGFLAIGGSGPEFVALRDMLTPSSDDDVATRGPDRGNNQSRPPAVGSPGQETPAADEEDKVLAGRADANMPALLTKDVKGG